MGGGLGKSKSSQNPASVWDVQSPYLEDLYGQTQAVGGQNTGQNYANQINQMGLGGLGQMQQGGFQNPQLQQGLQNFGQQQNQALGGAIQAGLGDINRNFQQNIMPGINTGSAMTNTSGGSRQGIAQGVAAGEANRNASDFVNRMYSNNFQNQMQNQLGAYGQMGQLQNQQNQMLGMGTSLAPQLANLGFGSQWGDLSQMANIYGSPTVLGGGGQSKSFDVRGGVFGGS